MRSHHFVLAGLLILLLAVATVGPGHHPAALADSCSHVDFGLSNTADGSCATTSGGRSNTASGDLSEAWS